MNAEGRMCPPPRSLAVEANGCFMVRVPAGPTEYKVAARVLAPHWRAPLGFVLDPVARLSMRQKRSRPGQHGAVLAAVSTAWSATCGDGLWPVLTATARGAASVHAEDEETVPFRLNKETFGTKVWLMESA